MMIRLSGNRRLNNGKTYLEAALDNLVGYRRSRSFPVIAFSGMIKLAVDFGCRIFNMDQKDVMNALKTPYFRKGLVNILGGIGMYGVTKPYRTPAPFLVVWNYTNLCNLRCKHCYQHAGKQSQDELTTDERLAIIDQLDENNVSALAFSGGEPLMCSDIFQVARYAHEKGIYISIATNGTLLTRENVARLKKAGVGYVEVSLDGATEESHERFRGIRGCFEKTIEGIKNSVKAGIYTCIATTATKHNIKEIPEIVELAKRLGVKRVIIFNFIPAGRGKEITHLDLSPEEREDLLKYLYEELTRGEIETLCTAPQYSRVCLQQSLIKKSNVLSSAHFAVADFHGRAKQLADFLGGCGAGRLYCAIQPNGLVTPCVFMPIVTGDLRRQSLREIWLKSKVMRDLRDREKLKGGCGICRYKYICGGCRARAYAYHGDYLAPDPGCIRRIEESSLMSEQRIKEHTSIIITHRV